MKLYLFGGAEREREQVDALIDLFNQVLSEIKPRQLLHVPYARLKVPEGEEELWNEGWVKAKLHRDRIELLDARSEADLARTNKPAIFINGGPERQQLIDAIAANQRLKNLILSADNYIGESAGSRLVGEYQRDSSGEKAKIIPGLGILKSTIIEPHYTQRNRHQALRDEMRETGVQFGIGIDSVTGVVIDTATFPEDYKIIGNGLVEFLNQTDLRS